MPQQSATIQHKKCLTLKCPNWSWRVSTDSSSVGRDAVLLPLQLSRYHVSAIIHTTNINQPTISTSFILYRIFNVAANEGFILIFSNNQHSLYKKTALNQHQICSNQKSMVALEWRFCQTILEVTFQMLSLKAFDCVQWDTTVIYKIIIIIVITTIYMAP